MKKILFITAFLITGMAFNCKAQASVQTKTTLNIINFQVYAKDSKLIVDWSTDGAKATNYWEVQRSAEGSQFSTIAIVLGPDPGQTNDQYQYVEKLKDTKNANAYYRLRHVNADGTEQISKIIQPAK